MRARQSLDVGDFLPLSFGVNYFDREIGSIKAADKGGWLLQSQLLNDVRTNVRRGRGRQRQRLHALQLLNRALQAQVIRAKVVTPGRDAMRFVDREERDAHLLQRLDEAAAAEALGRDVDQFEFAAAHGVDARSLFTRVQIELLIKVAGRLRACRAST